MLTLSGALPREAQLEYPGRYAAITARWLGRALAEHLHSPGADAPIRGERAA